MSSKLIIIASSNHWPSIDNKDSATVDCRSMSNNRANTTYLKRLIGVLIVFLLLLIGAYTHFIFEHEKQRRTSDKMSHSGIVNERPQIPAWRALNGSMEDDSKKGGASTTNNENRTRSKNTLATAIAPQHLRKLPVVDRAMLDKLDRRHRPSLPAAPARWPPIITRIPERRHRSRSSLPKTTRFSPCESPTHSSTSMSFPFPTTNRRTRIQGANTLPAATCSDSQILESDSCPAKR